MIKVTLKDGAVLEVEKGSSIIEIAKKISEGLARVATAGKVNGKVKDLRYQIEEDGANVEIADLVGRENIYIFGESSDTVIAHYEKADYVSRDYYENDPQIKEAVDFIVSERLMQVGQRENLERLYHELLNKDWFMTLLDYRDYAAKKEEIYKAYENRREWAKKMLVNTAKAGFFSSDRTIAEYDKDIWKLN